MAYAPSAVFLPGLAAPQIIETLDSEAIIAAMKADFLARFPSYDVAGLETDPAVLIFEVCAYRETLLRARVNDAARALLLAYAKGTDLDHLGAFFGVERLVVTPAVGSTAAVIEEDAAFRRRIQLAPEAYSSAGAKGAYIFHALTIDPTVFDAWAWRPQPGHVNVVLAGIDGTAVSDTVVAKLVDLFAQEDKTPLTDSVSVTKAQRVDYTVQMTLQIPRGPDPALIVSRAEAAIRAYAAERCRIKHTVFRNGLTAAAKVSGVENVVMGAPSADFVATNTQIPFLSGLSAIKTEIL
jgi:phage-related baseplate assembly protein